MQCSLTVDRNCNSGHIDMKMVNDFKNTYKKKSNLDSIVDQLCLHLQDIEDHEGTLQVGMPTCSIDQAESARRYYAAFPALKKGKESPLQYYLPPPVWCHKSSTDNFDKMQSEYPLLKDWLSKNKKNSPGKERRNSYHGQKKSRKRFNSYSRSFESKENLPEWMTHEGVWDMETQDPVKEFIRAIALDEGYSTCENTVTDEIKGITEAKNIMNESTVPDWDDSLKLDAEWIITEDLNPRVRSPVEEELYAKFEAKFDRSIEALWSKDQNTPDDEYQDLPIDFQDLLSSPSDLLFADPSTEKCSLISLTESIWSNDGGWDNVATERVESPTVMAETLHNQFRPLNLTDVPRPELQSFALYEGEDIYNALSTVAKTVRSYTAINHSRDCSGFAEVPQRRSRAPCAFPAPFQRAHPAEEPTRSVTRDREDLLTSARTHFRPIRRENETEGIRYADGDTFDIRGELDEVEFRRSESGGVYLEETSERYLEFRATRSIDYGRLNLTAEQRCPDLDDPGFKLRFPLRQVNAAVQTETGEDAWVTCECGRAAKKMRPCMESIWSDPATCRCAPAALDAVASAPAAEELSREWEELLSDISAAHAQYAGVGSVGAGGNEVEEVLVSAERKRRHSAALREVGDTVGGPGGGGCTHPHARFLHCCAFSFDRPLTR